MLFAQAGKVSDEPLTRYALLHEAKEQAVAAGDCDVALHIADAVGQNYEVDVLQLKADALDKVASQPVGSDERKKIILRSLALIPEASRVNQYDTALALADLAQAQATRLRDIPLRKRTRDAKLEVDQLHAEWKAVEAAVAKLLDDPNDADANVAYGKYVCLIKGDWQRGLPMLAKGSDAAIKSAAERDLASPSDAKSQEAVGDAWYVVAQSDESLRRFHARAHHWYTEALHDAAALSQIKLSKRIEEVAAIAEEVAKLSAVAAGPMTLRVSLRQTLEGHQGSVNCVVVSPDGKLVASGDVLGRIILWDAVSGRLLRTMSGHSQTVNDLDFSPDNSLLASASDDDTIILWHIETGASNRKLTDHRRDVKSVAFAPDGQSFASIEFASAPIRIWDASTGKGRGMLAVPQGSTPNCMAVSKDGAKMAVGFVTGDIALWDSVKGRPVGVLKGHSGYVNSLDFTPDGTRLVSGCSDGTLKIWDMETGDEQHSISVNSSTVYAVACSPDGRFIACGDRSLRIKFWNANTYELLQEVTGHSGIVRGLAYSANGKLLVSAGSDGVKMWDLQLVPLKPTIDSLTASTPSVSAPPPVEDEAAAVAALQKIGADVRDLGSSGRLVLLNSGFDDDDLLHLRALTDIRHLQLNDGNITQKGLAHLKELPQLNVLHIKCSSISDDDLQTLREMTSLKELSLQRTSVRGPGLVHLQDLTSLTALRLPDDLDADALRHITVLKNLTTVDLPITCDDRAIDYLGGLPKLFSLELSRTQVTDAGVARVGQLSGFSRIMTFAAPSGASGECLKHLASLPSLTTLHITDVQLIDGAENLKHLPKLKSLFVHGQQVVDAALPHLEGLPLDLLALTGDIVTDEGLKHLNRMTTLKNLGLHSGLITDEGLQNLSGLTELNALMLFNTKVSDEAIQSLRRALPKCNIQR